MRKVGRMEAPPAYRTIRGREDRIRSASPKSQRWNRPGAGNCGNQPFGDRPDGSFFRKPHCRGRPSNEQGPLLRGSVTREFASTGPRTRIDNGVTGDRARMLSGHVTAGIAVMHIPDAAGDMLLQDHDVARSNRRHARRRGSARETAPIGGEIQMGNDSTKAE